MASLLGAVFAGLGLSTTVATERLFTYSYEPETMPKGAREFEQWVTLRSGRGAEVGRENFNRWDFREEFEYGVTDLYTIGLYLNTRQVSYRDTFAGSDFSKFSFEGVSLENRYMIVNPADHPIGLALYLEPTYSGEEAALEQKIILGQRHGDWKWAVNLVHETEWEDHFHETIGVFKGTLGVARLLGKNWAVGLEALSETEAEDYKDWDSVAVFAGPVVSYRSEQWWAALTVMPQVWGSNLHGNPDNDRHFDLAGHERVQARLIFGINF